MVAFTRRFALFAKSRLWGAAVSANRFCASSGQGPGTLGGVCQEIGEKSKASIICTGSAVSGMLLQYPIHARSMPVMGQSPVTKMFAAGLPPSFPGGSALVDISVPVLAALARPQQFPYMLEGGVQAAGGLATILNWSGSFVYGEPPTPKPPTEWELSLGKITDTLCQDYPDFFRREPDFSVYDEDVTLEIGLPLEPYESPGLVTLQSKKRYVQMLRTLRKLGNGCVPNGTVHCKVYPYSMAHGANRCSIRVRWNFEGTLNLTRTPVHIHAFSSYSLAAQAFRSDESPLSYRIRRHKIEVHDIQPPFMRDVFAKALGHLQSKPEFVY